MVTFSKAISQRVPFKKSQGQLLPEDGWEVWVLGDDGQKLHHVFVRKKLPRAVFGYTPCCEAAPASAGWNDARGGFDFQCWEKGCTVGDFNPVLLDNSAVADALDRWRPEWADPFTSAVIASELVSEAATW